MQSRILLFFLAFVLVVPNARASDLSLDLLQMSSLSLQFDPVAELEEVVVTGQKEDPDILQNFAELVRRYQPLPDWDALAGQVCTLETMEREQGCQQTCRAEFEPYAQAAAGAAAGAMASLLSTRNLTAGSVGAVVGGLIGAVTGSMNRLGHGADPVAVAGVNGVIGASAGYFITALAGGGSTTFGSALLGGLSGALSGGVPGAAGAGLSAGAGAAGAGLSVAAIAALTASYFYEKLDQHFRQVCRDGRCNGV